MKNYQEFDDCISIKRVRREIADFRARLAIDREITHLYGLKLESYYDGLAQRMILELQAKVAAKKFAVKTVRFPDGAWQAIRHAIHGSGWMMYQCVRAHFTKHPVRYIEVTMEANAYHPDVAIPGMATFVDIATRVKMSGEGY